jgi:hypothetical protein
MRFLLTLVEIWSMSRVRGTLNAGICEPFIPGYKSPNASS